MDVFPLLQIYDRIPELRFKYMGFYSSDKVAQLQSSTQLQAMIEWNGEQWIMIARLDKTYYFSDSLDQKITIFFLSNLKVFANVPRKLQNTKNLCGFYANNSASLLLSSTRNLKIIHAKHVLNFINKFT